MNKVAQKLIKVWDLPTRIFHWALVICCLTSWLSVEMKWMLVHEVSGFTVLALLIHRVLWGFIGAKSARFSQFLVWPWQAIKYLRTSLSSHSDYHTGHNPAGGWMVIALIIILLTQSITGLFANNDLGFSGALASLVSKDGSDRSTSLHGMNFNILLALIWFHLVAVFFYVLVKNQNLIRAMITGKKLASQVEKTSKVYFVPAKRITFTILVSSIFIFIITNNN